MMRKFAVFKDEYGLVAIRADRVLCVEIDSNMETDKTLITFDTPYSHDEPVFTYVQNSVAEVIKELEICLA
jgi:hypothetical protein